MRRIRTVLSLLAVAVLLGAGWAQTRELTMWVRTPETVDLLRASIERFEAEHPDIEVTVDTFSADAYPGALQAAISGGDLPDMFQVHNSVPVPRLVSLGLIQPLEPHFSDGFRDRFDPATWWEGSTVIDDEIYAWPDRSFRRASLFLYVNNDVLRDLGLDTDEIPRDWDAFVDAAAEVHEASDGDIEGLHLGFTSGWFNERVVLQLATSVGDDHGVPAEHLPGKMVNWRTGEMFDHDEIPAVADFFRELMDRDAIHPDYLNTGRSQATAQWASGQAAFLFDGSWRLQELLRTEPDLDFSIAMLPAQDGGPVVWGVEGGSQNAFAVAETSPHAEEAALLFEFLSEDYYPALIENAVDLTPIPELNANDELFTSAQFRELVRLTEEGTLTLPSPVVRNIDQLETVVELSARSSRRPLGESMQGFFASGDFDVGDYLEGYAAEQQSFLEEALDAAREGGADVDASEWTFDDWVPTENYY